MMSDRTAGKRRPWLTYRDPSNLSPASRDGYVRGVSELAAPGATLLLLAFARRERGIGPASRQGMLH
jgi:hypothetical protein